VCVISLQFVGAGNPGRRCYWILNCEVSCLISARVTVHGLWMLWRRRTEYNKCKSRAGAWTSTVCLLCTARAARSVIQSHALGPPPYRWSVSDCWWHLWLPSYWAPPTDDQIVLIFWTWVHYSRSVCQTRKMKLKWEDKGNSVHYCRQQVHGEYPPQRLQALQRLTPGSAGLVGLIGWRYPWSLGRTRIHCWCGDVRELHWFCQASTPKGQPGDWKKTRLICREPSRSGTAIRPNDSSTSVHSLGEVAPNKTWALCRKCGNVGPVLGTVRVVHRQGPYPVYHE